jgi:hypothetical protein
MWRLCYLGFGAVALFSWQNSVQNYHVLGRDPMFRVILYVAIYQQTVLFTVTAVITYQVAGRRQLWCVSNSTPRGSRLAPFGPVPIALSRVSVSWRGIRQRTVVAYCVVIWQHLYGEPLKLHTEVSVVGRSSGSTLPVLFLDGRPQNLFRFLRLR